MLDERYREEMQEAEAVSRKIGYGRDTRDFSNIGVGGCAVIYVTMSRLDRSDSRMDRLERRVAVLENHVLHGEPE